MAIVASASELDQALESVRALLGADGFGLGATLESGTLALAVEATPDACHECLVGEDLFVLIILDALAEAGIAADSADIETTYPAGS
jgi:hypothetical protein